MAFQARPSNSDSHTLILKKMSDTDSDLASLFSSNPEESQEELSKLDASLLKFFNRPGKTLSAFNVYIHIRTQEENERVAKANAGTTRNNTRVGAET